LIGKRNAVSQQGFKRQRCLFEPQITSSLIVSCCCCARQAVDDERWGQGEGLEVVEQEVEAVPLGPDNPHGNAFRVVEAVLEDEMAAQRVASPMTGRVWKIRNPHKLNALGVRGAGSWGAECGGVEGLGGKVQGLDFARPACLRLRRDE
jgi:hypothetical protein